MPPIRKVIVGTFPGVLLLIYFMLFDDEPQQQARKPKPQPSASASVSAVTSAPPPPTASSTGPVVITPPTASSTTTNPNPPPSATATVPKGKATLERQAIDLVGQGQFAKAADIYDQLAAQAPTAQQQTTYREAARILRTR